MRVIDIETTDVRPSTAEVIEIASFDPASGTMEDSLFGVFVLTPESQQVHQITESMIAGKMRFVDSDVDAYFPREGYLVAHNVPFTLSVLEVNMAAMDRDDVLDRKRWISTRRIAEKVLAPHVDKNLQHLRHYFGIDDPGLVPNRAASDARIVWSILERMTEGVVDINDTDAVYEFCWSPREISIWPIGKHQGKPIEEVPYDYLIWAINNMEILDEGSNRFDPDLAAAIEKIAMI